MTAAFTLTRNRKMTYQKTVLFQEYWLNQFFLHLLLPPDAHLLVYVTEDSARSWADPGGGGGGGGVRTPPGILAKMCLSDS